MCNHKNCSTVSAFICHCPWLEKRHKTDFISFSRQINVIFLRNPTTYFFLGLEQTHVAVRAVSSCKRSSDGITLSITTIPKHSLFCCAHQPWVTPLMMQNLFCSDLKSAARKTPKAREKIATDVCRNTSSVKEHCAHILHEQTGPETRAE